MITIDVINSVRGLSNGNETEAERGEETFNWRMEVQTAHDFVHSVTFLAPVDGGPPPEFALVSPFSKVGIEHHYHQTLELGTKTAGFLMEVPQILILEIADQFFAIIRNDHVVNQESHKKHKHVFHVSSTVTDEEIRFGDKDINFIHIGEEFESSDSDMDAF